MKEILSQNWTGEEQPAFQRGSLVLAIGFFVLAGLIFSTAFFENSTDMVLTIVLVGIMVSYGTIKAKAGKLDYFEIFFPFSVLYFLYFGMSGIFLKLNVDLLPSNSLLPWLTPALRLALVGYIAMTAGYLTMFRRVRPSKLCELRQNGISFLLLVGAVGFLGQVAGYVQTKWWISRRYASGILSIGQQVAVLYFFAWYLLWYMIWAKKLNRLQMAVLLNLFIVASLVVLYLKLGSKEMAIMLMGVPAVAFWYSRRKMPWKSILAVLLVAIFVIFPLYNTFRHQNERYDKMRRLDQALDVATSWDMSGFFNNSLRAFLSRMGIIVSVAAVLRDVPAHLEYRNGETLILAPVGLFVPRILWPGKPMIDIGREFGVTFRLVNVIDRETNIAPSLVGEFYWNFGLAGVVIGMFFTGGVYRLLYRKYGEPRRYAPIASAVYAILFIGMIHFEGSFAGILGTSVKSLVVLYVLIAVSRKFNLLIVEEPSGGAPSSQPAGTLRLE